jgi:hypothetical protein
MPKKIYEIFAKAYEQWRTYRVYDRHCQNALYIFQAKKTSSGDQ